MPKKSQINEYSDFCFAVPQIIDQGVDYTTTIA